VRARADRGAFRCPGFLNAYLWTVGVSAQASDEEAYRRLVEPHRSELHAHCYRMLGSVHDADDALQDALLRAWRALPRLEQRGALRSWLYRIATNASLDLLARRPKRVLPIDAAGVPVSESTWIEPYPEAVPDGRAAPEARYELRESVELAFVAALQHLPPNQRAALILREVLGFSAQDVADALETSVASVNSALQRARKTLDDRLPERTQQATLRALGDERLRELVERYADAMERDDIDAVVEMLAEDAAWSMPPMTTWYRGRAALERFLADGPLSGRIRWRHRVTTANGQPAVGGYTWHEAEGAFLPFALDVLTLRGDRILEVTAFIARSPDGARLPDDPPDPARVEALFERFGLPTRVER
jgi:RNA polymerase sigma-70 factor (ECF subfamily)